MLKHISRFAALFCLCALAGSPALGAWAVALNRANGQPIVARDYGNVGQAKRQALGDCRGLYGNCEIVASANSGCLALAVAGNKWGVGQGRPKTVARDAALAECTALKAGPCKVVHEFCGL